MSRLRNLMFPLMLALILGGLSAWLGRISEVKLEEVALKADEPQYLMTQMRGVRFAEDGSLGESLSAERAWQLPEKRYVHFQSPELHLYQNGRQQYQVRSAQARYDTETRQVLFEREVLLDKPADGERPAAQVSTASLTVDTRAQTAYTDQAVNYRYGRSTGSAHGMRYDHKQGRLDLPAKVKALIYDTDSQR